MNDNIFSKKWFLVLIIACALILAAPQRISASPKGIEIIGNCGLVVEASTGKENTGNLNPGDTKRSKLTLKNTGSNRIKEIDMQTNIISGSRKSPRGGKLEEILRLTIKDGENIIIDNLPFTEAAEITKALGSLDVGQEKVLDLIVDFTSAADNDYQGASFQASWTFITKCGGGGDDEEDPPPDDDDDTPPGDKEKEEEEEEKNPPDDVDDEDEDRIEVDDESIPSGSGGKEEESVASVASIEPEEIPYGPGKMPKTGEISPMFFYGTGALVSAIGMAIRKAGKRKKQ